jgi:DNA polymerase III subunit delta
LLIANRQLLTANPMSHPILERHLKGRTLRPLYLFYGDEEFLMQRALARLEAGLTGEAGEPPTRLLREAQEVELSEFLTEARAATLWGPGQLLILRGAEAYPADQLQAVTAYLDHPAPRAWVVLVAAGLKAREVEKHKVWGRLYEQEAALGFFRLRESELYQWLTREAKHLGKNLALPAAQRLVEMVGDNLAELSQELEKLALYAGSENTLTPTLVSQLASHSRNYNIFALVEALGEPNFQPRLASLAHLLDLGEHPVKILAMLARQVRLLIRVKEAGKGNPAELARSLKLPPWNVKRLTQQATRFSHAALQAHLDLLHRVDYHLKTSTGNPRLWLEWALVKMGPG